MNQQTNGTLMVAASAAGFATLAIFIKFAYAAGVNTVTMLAGRFLLASLILWIVILLRKIPYAVDKKAALQLYLMGTLGYGTMSVFFALSLHYLPASLTAMLLYLYPALVSLLSFGLDDERFSWAKGGALSICFAGLFLVLGVSFDGVQPLGIVLGISAAVVYSCYIVVSNRVLKKINPLVAATYVCTSAGITLAVYGGVSGVINVVLPLQGWLAILGIALLGTVVGIFGFFAGMSRIGAANASIISTIEPVITVMLSAMILNESITLPQASGGILILVGVLILQMWAKQHPEEKTAAMVSVSRK